MAMFIYIAAYEGLAVYNPRRLEVVDEHRVAKIGLLKPHPHSLVVCHGGGVYSGLPECIRLINNLLILYMLRDLCLDIVVDVEYTEEANNPRKHSKDRVHEGKLTVGDYEVWIR